MNLYFTPDFVRMVGWSLLHFVWQGAVVAALLSLFMAFCRRAALRYTAGVCAMLLMLALPFATFFVLQQPHTSTTPGFATETISLAPVTTAWGPTAVHHRITVAAAPETQSQLMFWLVKLWMAGVVLFTLRSAGGVLLVQRLRRVAGEQVSGDLLRLCVVVQNKMGIARAIRFCRSAALQVPAVVGGIRPMVLLPITALTGLNELQIEAIIAHELAHIRRFDYFVNLFQVFAETVLFYHPAVWWVNKCIRAERENCCDDVAIAVCGDRLQYVRALTHLESLRLTPQFAMAANGSPLKARVRRLLGMAEEPSDVRSQTSVFGLLVIAGIALAATSVVNHAKAQDQPPVVPQPPEIRLPAIAVRNNVPSPMVSVAPASMATPSPTVAPVMPTVVRTQIPVLAHTFTPVSVRLSMPVVASYAAMVAQPSMRAVLAQASVPAVPSAPAAPAAPAVPATPSTSPSESYVDGMKSAGYGDLTVDELVAMKVQGVTPEYVRQMREAGLKMDADDLIALKVQGVTPEYVKQVRSAYPGIDTDSIVGMKVQGVTPEYAAEFAKLGVKADADEIIGLKIQGVTPEYVRAMRATGINFDTDELIGMKVQGVTPAYVSSLKSAGITGLDADEIIGAKTMGITPEFIEKARSHGFKDLDLDKLIELKNVGIL